MLANIYVRIYQILDRYKSLRIRFATIQIELEIRVVCKNGFVTFHWIFYDVKII